MGVEQAYNFRAVNEQVLTSGRVEPEQLAQLADAGVEVVINLLPASSQYAVANEQGIVESQGIDYLYLPIDFAAPTLAEFEQFTRLMAQAGERKVLIHCAANYRVSAFYSRYAVQSGLWNKEDADQFMLSIWQPQEHAPWPQWLEEVGQANTP